MKPCTRCMQPMVAWVVQGAVCVGKPWVIFGIYTEQHLAQARLDALQLRSFNRSIFRIQDYVMNTNAYDDTPYFKAWFSNDL